MGGGVGVKADQVGTGLGEQSRQGVDRLHHQVHIDGHGHTRCSFGMWFQGLTDHGAEGQVGYIVVVHHVEVNPVSTSGDDVFHLVAQTGKVGGQDGGGDAVSGVHGLNYGVRMQLQLIFCQTYFLCPPTNSASK